jgi:prepilin-type N-terminal cleavage/methylation domain-containing protein
MIVCSTESVVTTVRVKTNDQRGFTLIELAVVLLILGILLAGILIPFTTQIELRRTADTQKTLLEIREALIGFAAAQGRLPCPASDTSDGAEAAAAGGNDINGNCANFFDGFAPGVTLGVGPTDGNGYVLDGWNNRIRYAVSKSNQIPTGTPPPPPPTPENYDFTGMGTFPASTGEMRNITMAKLSPDLRVCSTATGITADVCATGTSLVDTAVAVIYSIGSNAARPDPGGTRIDENANPNPNAASSNRTFVSHERAGETAPNGEFDDIVIWLSPNILYTRMIAAGRLP